MNSMERIWKTALGQSVDRIPVIVLGRAVLMKMRGMNFTRQSLCDIQGICRTELEGQEDFKWDTVLGRIYYPLEEDILGASIQDNQDTYPSIRPPYVINKLADLDKMNIDNLYEHPHFLAERELIQTLYQAVQDQVPVMGYCQGPLRMAAQLRGLEPLLMDMTVDKAFYHSLLKKTTEWSILRARLAIDAGAKVIFIGEPVASGNLISPTFYKEFALPYHQLLIRMIKQSGEAKVILHICGNTSGLIPMMGESGADILHVEKVDLKEVHALTGGKLCLLGNIDPVGIMLQGSPQDVERAARDCCAKMEGNPGFILGPGCSLPPLTPSENIHALRRAVL